MILKFACVSLQADLDLDARNKLLKSKTSQATILKAKWKKILVQACIPKYQYSRVRIFWINWWLSETKLNSLL